MNRFGLSHELFTEIIFILEKYPGIDKAYIFGSRARGDYTEKSDIDIALVGIAIDSKSLNLIISELDSLKTILTFDLLDLSKVKKETLRKNIINEGVLIYDRQKSIIGEV